MSMLSIAGGFYLERCIEPQWNELFGSGGRAAAAVAGQGTHIRLHTYVWDKYRKDAQRFADDRGVELIAAVSDRLVSFNYFHPLSTPVISPAPGRLGSLPPIKVEGPVVLRFGMLEGDAVVTAERAVYDPQSAFVTPPFSENGSRADHLALVLNRGEALRMAGEKTVEKAADALLGDRSVEAVIIKQGSLGALVATKTGRSRVPAYVSDSVWKIGSGDVFSAMFAHYWGVKKAEPQAAAELASRATAHYVETRHLPAPSQAELVEIPFTAAEPMRGKVYLAGPFFDIGQRWLIEEAKADLESMGVKVFSPIHDVGLGTADRVAEADLSGLAQCSVVLAILNGMDPGTIFEVGYATKMRIPVVALAQNVKEEDMKMIVGSGATVVFDYCTAIYKTIWSGTP